MKYTIPICLLLFLLAATATRTWAENTKYDFVIAKDGTGNFTTVQAAIDAVPDHRKNTTTIFIKKGEYKEKLVLPESKNNVMFIGEHPDSTILTYNDYALKQNRFGEEMGTAGSASVYIYGHHFTAENITFANSAGPVGQALAVWVQGDKARFFNCRFLGFQDTMYTNKGRHYFKDCYIEGTVDFIFGSSTAVFDGCTIFCKTRGYITAASTPAEQAYGYVFLRCTITGSAPEGSFYLGRPWRPHAKVAFIDCKLAKVIHPAGWDNWNKPENEQTAYYAEHNNSGAGATPAARVTWAHQLTAEEAKEYTLEKIFGTWDPEVRQLVQAPYQEASR